MENKEPTKKRGTLKISQTFGAETPIRNISEPHTIKKQTDRKKVKETSIKKSSIKKPKVSGIEKKGAFTEEYNEIPKTRSTTRQITPKTAETPQNKTGAYIMIIVIIVIGIIVINSMIENNKSSPETVTREKFIDPGFYNEGSNEWPYYGRTTDQLIKELNNEFYGFPAEIDVTRKLMDKVGLALRDDKGTTSTIRRYDLLEVPISYYEIKQDGEWKYGKFYKGGVKPGDSRLK